MKAIIPIIKTALVVLAGIILHACSSDETINHPVPTHKVNIKASGFSTSVEPMKKSSENKLTDHISKLHYFVMIPNKNGNTLDAVKHVEQDHNSNPANFGNIELELENGDYTIFIIGEQKNEAGGYSKVSYRDARPYLLYNNTPVGDLFISKQVIKVENASTAANFTLERMVGQLEVKIIDPIPAQADNVKIIIRNEVGDYYFDIDDINGLPSSRLYETQIKDSDIGSTTFSKKLYVLKTGGPILNVEVRFYDKANNIIASKSKDNVEVQRNQKTTLTVSNMLSKDSDSGKIAVTIDDIWGNGIVKEF